MYASLLHQNNSFKISFFFHQTQKPAVHFFRGSLGDGGEYDGHDLLQHRDIFGRGGWVPKSWVWMPSLKDCISIPFIEFLQYIIQISNVPWPWCTLTDHWDTCCTSPFLATPSSGSLGTDSSLPENRSLSSLGTLKSFSYSVPACRKNIRSQVNSGKCFSAHHSQLSQSLTQL